MQTYDVTVIGSGTGGQTAACDLKDAGLNDALVENSGQPGGGRGPEKPIREKGESIKI
ncbi:MAG: FAD-binding protein [Proteobacteria bacterium]|nr:FAD-binding protein [Pseudomonadota bacterium]